MNTYELIAIAVIIRVVGSFHDGLNVRAVNWWFWHIINWLRRDLIIAWIAWRLLASPWQSFDRAADWMIIIALNYVLHQLFYRLGRLTT